MNTLLTRKTASPQFKAAIEAARKHIEYTNRLIEEAKNNPSPQNDVLLFQATQISVTLGTALAIAAKK